MYITYFIVDIHKYAYVYLCIYKHTRIVLVNCTSIGYEFTIEREIALTPKQSWHLSCANMITLTSKYII